jgi:TP901 family phage tail tape measure protein
VASASSLTFRLFGEDVSASRTLDRVGAEAEGLSGKFGRLGAAGGAALAGIAVAAGAVGAASVKMAMDFDQQMARLQTQAHVPAAAIKGLSDQVLNLAGQVGIGPTSLAEALYHVESSFASTGISGQKAMDILRAAAEGARIGGSNLVDTQNALDAAVVSGIKGITNYQQAMGALNATVGAGDMSMQDLADAMGTGVLAVVKNYGVTLNDASAALATFGDNNIRGADAGTALRMAVQSLAVPAQKGAALLGDIGLNAHSLAVDMQQGGLNQALQDLNKHMTDAGITGSKVGDFLTESFGKKAGVGLALLIGQFDRFESKYAEADKGAKQFAQDWRAQQQQFSQVLHQLEAGAEAVGVRIGNFLIPKIMEFGKAIGNAWHSLNQQAGGQQSILKEVMTGFNNPAMTNFDSGFGGALERIGIGAHKLGDEAHKLWGELSHNLKPVFHDVWDFISNSLLPALSNLWTAFDPSIHRALHDVTQALQGLGDIIKNYAGPWLKDITKWMADHKQVMHDFADVTVIVFTAWAGYKVWEQANTAAKSLTKSIGELKAASATPGGKIAWIAGISLGL